MLRALDYFGSTGERFEPAMAEALALVSSKQDATGRWPLERTHEEALPLPFPEALSEPSRWMTLRALCVTRRAAHCL